MSKQGWQDNAQMKDSEMVQKWTNLLQTVEEAVEQLNHPKESLVNQRENLVNSEETKMANWNSSELNLAPALDQIAQNAQNAINNVDILLNIV